MPVDGLRPLEAWYGGMTQGLPTHLIPGSTSSWSSLDPLRPEARALDRVVSRILTVGISHQSDPRSPIVVDRDICVESKKPGEQAWSNLCQREREAKIRSQCFQSKENVFLERGVHGRFKSICQRSVWLSFEVLQLRLEGRENERRFRFCAFGPIVVAV